MLELGASYAPWAVFGALVARRFAEQGRDDIMIVVGGIIPPADFAALRDAGAAAIFPPGTPVTEAARVLLDELNARLGYQQRRPTKEALLHNAPERRCGLGIA